MFGRNVLSARNKWEVSLSGVGTVLRLERDAWSMVKRLRQATNEYPPLPRVAVATLPALWIVARSRNGTPPPCRDMACHRHLATIEAVLYGKTRFRNDAVGSPQPTNKIVRIFSSLFFVFCTKHIYIYICFLERLGHGIYSSK